MRFGSHHVEVGLSRLRRRQRLQLALARGLRRAGRSREATNRRGALRRGRQEPDRGHRDRRQEVRGMKDDVRTRNPGTSWLVLRTSSLIQTQTHLLSPEGNGLWSIVGTSRSVAVTISKSSAGLKPNAAANRLTGNTCCA